MSEATIQAGIQATFQAMAQFDSADVTICDWSILDGANSAGPYVIIEPADDVRSRQDVVTPENRYGIKVGLWQQWADYETSLVAFATLRQAMLTAFNTTTGERNPGATNADITEIRNITPIQYAPNPNLPPELAAQADPIFIMQMFVFDTVEY